MSIFNFKKRKKKNILKYNRKLLLIVFLFIFLITTTSIISLANFGGGQTENTPNLQRGLVGHWTMDENSYVEGTENIFPKSANSLAFNSAYNGSSYGFGSNTNIQQEIDNSLRPNSKSAITKVSRINSGISQRDYVHIGIHSPLNSTRVISFWYYGTFGTQIRPYNNDASASLYYLNNEGNWIGGGTGVNIPVIANQWQKIVIKIENRGVSAGTGWSWFIMHYDNLTTTLSNEEYWAFTEFQLEEKDYPTPYVNGIRQTRLADSTPYGNHGTTTIENSPTLGSDRFGKEGGVMNFNGSSDYIRVEGGIAGKNNVTMAGWALVDSSGYILNQFQSTGNSWAISATTNLIRIFNDTSGVSNLTHFNTSIPVGEWVHFAGGHKDDGWFLYVNGELVGDGLQSGSGPSSVSGNLFFGQRGNDTTYFGGKLDDVRVYDRALSPEEVNLLYDSYKPQLQVTSLNSGLIGHWSLNEVDYNPSTNRVSDLTPYSNHGTNYGANFTTDRHGKEGGAMRFNNGNRIMLQNIEFSEDDNWSFTTWYNLDGDGHNCFNTWSGPRFYNGRLRFYHNQGGADNMSPSFNGWANYGEWEHLSIVKENNEIRGYINGEYVGTIGFEDRIYVVEQISRTHSIYGWDGELDDIRVYDRALSSQEIEQLYSSYRPKLVIDSEPLISMNCNPPTTGRWTITDRVVCVNEIISVDELVLINNGGELHLHNVTFNMDHPSTSQSVLRINSGGKLYSNDTLFTSNINSSRAQYIRTYAGGESYFNNTTLIGTPINIRFRNNGYAEINNSNFDYQSHFYSSSETHIKESHIRSPYLYIESGHEMEINNFDRLDTNLTYNFTSNNGFRLNTVNSHLRGLLIYNTRGKLTINNSNIQSLLHYNYNVNQGTFVNNSSIFTQYYMAYESNQTVNVENIHEPLTSFTGIIAETSNDKNIHFDNSNITRLYYYSTNGVFNIKDSTIYRFYGITNSQNELDNVAITNYLYLYSNSINTIKNSNISNSYRIYIRQTSQTNLINSSLNSSNFRLYETASINSDTNSTLNRLRLTSGSPSISGYTNIDNFSSWTSGAVLNRELPFKVLNTSMNPVIGATVAIYDGGSLLDSATSNSLGKVNLSISADNSANQGKTYEVRVNGQVANNVTILESSGPDGIELIGNW